MIVKKVNENSTAVESVNMASVTATIPMNEADLMMHQQTTLTSELEAIASSSPKRKSRASKFPAIVNS